MTPTPKHQRCGHLAAGPDGFPCPHPTCWPGGVLQVVPVPDGPEEFWERLLYVPRGGAMFFGWRLVGEVVETAAASEDAHAATPIGDPSPVDARGSLTVRAAADLLVNAHGPSDGVSEVAALGRERRAVEVTTGPLEPIPAFGDGAMVATERNAERLAATQQQVVHEMAGEVSEYLKKHPEQARGGVEMKPKKRGKR